MRVENEICRTFKNEHFKVCSESNLSVGAIAAISSSADALVATNLDSRLDFFVISRLNVRLNRFSLS